MNHYKYIRIILIAIPVLALIYLFNKQYPFNGKLEIVYDFKRPNAFIRNLIPAGRLSEIRQDGKIYFQEVKIDPVYFDLELPGNYQSATVELTYQIKNQPILEIGGLVSDKNWNFKTSPIQNISQQGDWTVGNAVVDLNALRKDNNKVKIVISAPNFYENNGELKISKIRVVLETKPLLDKVYNRLANILNK